MRPLPDLLLVATLALAGCTQLDAAKQELGDAQTRLDEARAALDTARQEAKEAKDRFDRVQSAAVAREERVTLTLTPIREEDKLRFAPNATRSDGTSVPAANLTKLPLLLVSIGEASFECDPLTCRVGFPDGASVTVAFAATPTQATTLTAGEPLPTLTLADALVTATTALRDVTD